MYIMQEPIEPTEALEDSENVLIDDGVLSFEHVDFKYDIVLLPDPEGPTKALT
jgi:ATP-binding cassette subfamily B protein AbcA/BmrA